ncbi:MAG: RecQ family ATP-dependent DNA helicase [Sphaerochaeta sp.]|uniref:RecQ family ATP-dependent DNA helicase n=1 Tax=Sphaerochaeta sp. TaxID=1972642 RepID=UPI003D12D02F
MTDIDRLAATFFSIHALRPFQQLVIHHILEHDRSTADHDGTLVTLPTGSGKSICFMLPSLLVEGLTVIVYPLLSLMQDQRRRFAQANIPCICLRGGQTKEQRRLLFARLPETKVVITNAECLCQTQVFSILAQFTISLLVLDEAHTIVRWGEGFRPILASVGTILAHLPIRQLLCFTATADQPVVQGLDRLVFHHRPVYRVKGSVDRQNISYHVVRTLCKEHAIARLLGNAALRPALVFCPTRGESEHGAYDFLLSHPGVPVRYYHAGLTSQARNHLEEWFLKQSDGVLYATNAFGMGVDKKNIRTVVHHTLPSDILAFLQESGRAGRDGRPAVSIILLDERERSSPTASIFSNTTTCFRMQLVGALDETLESCSGCDICNGTLGLRREGQSSIIQAVGLHPFQFSPGSLTAYLQQGGVAFREKHLRKAIGSLLDQHILCCTNKNRRRLYLPIRTYLACLTGASASLMLKKGGTHDAQAKASQTLPDPSPTVSSPEAAGRTTEDRAQETKTILEEVVSDALPLAVH